MLPARPLLYALPTAILALLCAAFGTLWVIEPVLGTFAWPVRIAVAGVGLCLAAGVWTFGIQRHRSEQRLAQRYLDQLCRLDLHRSGSADEGDSFPQLSLGNLWRNDFERLRDKLAGYSAKMEETELARAAAEVRSRRALTERAQLLEIVASLTDPVLAVGPYGELLHANPAAEKLFGLKTGPGTTPLIDQLRAYEEVVNLLNDARRRKTVAPRHAELALTDSTGRRAWYRAAVRSLSQAGEAEAAGDRGAQYATLLVLTDITAHKAMQQRNAEFVSAASHEMKTPLSSIRAYIELLADGEAEDEATREEFFEVIQTQAERLQRLIEDLLHLARIEAGVVAVQKEARSLNELLQEAADVVQPTAEAKQITLTTEFSPLYLGVLADRDTLLQAAINLLSNAIKYTPNGGSVTLRSRLSGDEVAFEVSDTGVGLSPEDCQKVFDKFYRVKKDQQMAAGTGLGLPLVKHIVEDIHAGRIEVASELGKGSTFGVVLPALGQLSA